MAIQREKWTCDVPNSLMCPKEQNQGCEPAKTCPFLPATGPSELLKQISRNGKREARNQRDGTVIRWFGGTGRRNRAAEGPRAAQTARLLLGTHL